MLFWVRIQLNLGKEKCKKWNGHEKPKNSVPFAFDENQKRSKKHVWRYYGSVLSFNKSRYPKKISQQDPYLISCRAQVGRGKDNCYWDSYSLFKALLTGGTTTSHLGFFLCLYLPLLLSAPLFPIIVKRDSIKQGLLPLTLSHQEPFWKVPNEGTNVELISFIWQ